MVGYDIATDDKKGKGREIQKADFASAEKTIDQAVLIALSR